ncbi:hypothetical protein C8R44DRAFT_889004 [Mycena epipterygia]|nr:hypothetical protein C8R44DRAFT_889004 [Mycena epipterygia]
MNENTVPAFLDLSKLHAPQMDAARMLISPPPEEELQRTHVFGFPRTNNSAAQAKRKRPGVGGTPSKAPAEAVETTPNPKPRKTGRRRSLSMLPDDSPTRPTFSSRKSPHARNPDADWMPPPRDVVRRSATPSVVPYEPPADVFVPPREVILHTPQPKPRKPRRQSAAPSTRPASLTPLRVVVQSVKKELPPIDLARPMTPPSPTDDPLLLLPSSSPIKRVGRKSTAQYDDSSDADYAPFDWTAGLPQDTADAPTSDSMDLDAPASFDGPAPGLDVGGGWDSDSDDEGELPAAVLPSMSTSAPASVLPSTSATATTPNPSAPPTTATATATGPYTTLLRPTKADPPTPGTKARADAWGVWGSPFPGCGEGSFRMDGRRGQGLLQPSALQHGEGLGQRGEGGAEGGEGEGMEEGEEEEEDEDEEMAEEGVSILRALREEDALREGGASNGAKLGGDEQDEEEEVRAMSVDVDVDADEGRVDDEQEREDEDEDEEEEEEVRRMSVEPEMRPLPSLAFQAQSLASPNPTSRSRHASADDGQEARFVVQPTPVRAWAAQTPARAEERKTPTQTRQMQIQAQTPPTRQTPRVPPRTERAGIARDNSENQEEADADEEQDGDTDKGRQRSASVFSALGERVSTPNAHARGKAKFVPADVDVGGDLNKADADVDIEGDVDVDGDADGDGDSSDSEDGALLGLVKITSADPRAAARAAAILKQLFSLVLLLPFFFPLLHTPAELTNTHTDTHPLLLLLLPLPPLLSPPSPLPHTRSELTNPTQHDYDCFTRLRAASASAAGRRRHSYAGVSKASLSAPRTPVAVNSTFTAASMFGGMQELGGLQDIAALRARANSKNKAGASASEKMKAHERKERARDKQEEKMKRERRQSARVVGERVYFPGSPGPVTTAELLEEAEREVGTPFKAVSVSAPGFGSVSTPFKSVSAPFTPFKSASPAQEEGERAWGKADWKALDACFTDERIALAARQGMVLNVNLNLNIGAPSTPVRRDSTATVMMAAADAVDLAAVVARFVDQMGGAHAVSALGPDWETENLTQRARALQNKQRAGHVAPPTPSAPAKEDVFADKRRPSMEVPNFTPLGKRAMPPGRGGRLPPPVGSGAPFSALPPTPEPLRRRRVPGSLLAPRYSHLLDEAVAVSVGASPSPSQSRSEPQEEEGEGETSFTDEGDSSFASSTDGGDADTEMAPTTPLREREALVAQTAQPAPVPATIGKRVKGFLFSYLPTLAKTAPPAPTRTGGVPARPRLPLPPLELLEKPRGPIATPVRPPLPKTRAPKELVTLQPAPPPPKPASLLPRRAPRRLVDLHHVSPPPEDAVVARGPRPRTSSGGSVKDLVKNFEALDDARGKAAEVKRVRSVGDFGKRGGAGAGAARPTWRP